MREVANRERAAGAAGIRSRQDASELPTPGSGQPPPPGEAVENPTRFKPGNPYRFRPGQSGNPAGYSERRRLTVALARLVERKLAGDPRGRDWAELVVTAMLQRAITGDVKAATLLWDRLEGKPAPAINVRRPAEDDRESQTDLIIHVVNSREEAVALGAGPRAVREREKDDDGVLPL